MRRVVGKVVVSVAERKPALTYTDYVVVGVLLVCRHEQGEQEVFVFEGAAAEEFLARGDGINLGDMSFERRGSFTVEPHGVHDHVVEVADLLPYRAFLVVGCGNVPEETVQSLKVVV